MLGDINGEPGSGKSLLLVLLAKMREGKCPIYSNLTLKINGAKRIAIQDLENINTGLLLIDEAYGWLESRNSSSALNQYMSRLIFQSRKRRLDLFSAEQLRSTIDLRMRDLSTLTILALGKNKNETAFEYAYVRNFTMNRFVIPIKLAEKLYPLYDTYEFPATPSSSYEPTGMNKLINKRIKELRKRYKKKTMTLTKNMIKDYLIEKKQFEVGLHDQIHARIKREALEA